MALVVLEETTSDGGRIHRPEENESGMDNLRRNKTGLRMSHVGKKKRLPQERVFCASFLRRPKKRCRTSERGPHTATRKKEQRSVRPNQGVIESVLGGAKKGSRSKQFKWGRERKPLQTHESLS